MHEKILVANRGACAVRVFRTLRKLGIPSVAVYTEEDADSLHVGCADEAVLLTGAGNPYLSFDAVLGACASTGATAIHPGYGFLSENAGFAELAESKGITFIGPTPNQIRLFGLKHEARALAQSANVPLLPGSGLLKDVEEAKGHANRVGYPVLLKSTAGGGGIGLKMCENEQELVAGFDSVKRTAGGAFKDSGVFLEKFLARARHVEVQIFGDSHGNVVSLGERDCSSQRRSQKVVEESPAPFLPEFARVQLAECAVSLARVGNYRSAGTVEFVVDASNPENFYFLEVNTRIQVEHGVTEMVLSPLGSIPEESQQDQSDGHALDLIAWMILDSCGELDLSKQTLPKSPLFHAIQCRVYAEDANKNFSPSSGILTCAEFPAISQYVRVETWVNLGVPISSLYDPMLGKIIARGATREEALQRLIEALNACHLSGVETNVAYLRDLLGSTQFNTFGQGQVHTRWLDAFKYEPSTMDVLDGGTQSSIQDYPGRINYWAVGVPPSGPMDHVSFRLANRLVGNAETDPALEMTLRGGQYRFNCDVYVALVGAPMAADVDGTPILFEKAVRIAAKSTLTIGTVSPKAGGCRAYLAVSQGGFDVPNYLGSKSTFMMGKFGGHAGRALARGDVLHCFKGVSPVPIVPTTQVATSPLLPRFSNTWRIHVTIGPHAAPDFFKSEYVQQFFNSDFVVHFNSNRLGIRLTPPSEDKPPAFARLDGGDAGLHPSNVHDTVYAIGSINFTGDMPVILTQDGPSLGGFVCLCTVVKSDLWKVGQLCPADRIRFVAVTYESAVEEEVALNAFIASAGATDIGSFSKRYKLEAQPESTTAVDRSFTVNDWTEDATSPPLQVVYRRAGDKAMLIEYGEQVLDFRLRFRVHAFEQSLRLECAKRNLIVELSPGVRSIQVVFDSLAVGSKSQFLDLLEFVERGLPKVEDVSVESRTVRLPLAFDSSTTKEAIEKYRQSIRDKAPWLPSNVEFIRRINGFDSIEQVMEIVYSAQYMVLGLGDVYNGAPCATPIDPRHRLVTTKYSPARTWTAVGEVGIGGAYMCIYALESPGGYQLIGGTVPVWSTYPKRDSFGELPWLLRPFDRVQFYSVTEQELAKVRHEWKIAPKGFPLDITKSSFTLREYVQFLNSNADSITQFRSKQKIAFDAEREMWARTGAADFTPKEGAELKNVENEHDDHLGEPIYPEINGSVWTLDAKEGDMVVVGQKVATVEAMKLEVEIKSKVAGRVGKVCVHIGKRCAPHDVLMRIIKEADEPKFELLAAMDGTIPAFEALYAKYPVRTVMMAWLDRIETLKGKHANVFISQKTRADVLKEATALDELKPEEKAVLPLFGVPFAVKDNYDVKGMKTTCACPEYGYEGEESAFVVSKLEQAGGLLIGKTNMDQFAAGLVGVRSPYGACSSVYNKEYISGGSSSGSAVAVASRMCAFSLGTDTAGSGRVPAGCNNIVGLKPTRGRVSCAGVVPACKSLDCVSVFALDCADASKVFDVLDVPDPKDDWCRTRVERTFVRSYSGLPRFGVFDPMDFLGDAGAEVLFQGAIHRLEFMGWEKVEIDYAPFKETASLLYQGPWVAERLHAVKDFIKLGGGADDRLHPVTNQIIQGGAKFSAVDAFHGIHRLQKLKRACAAAFENVDFVLVPTAPTTYKIAEVEADPVKLNSNMGLYTNFVNFLDLAAVAVPAGFRDLNGASALPFGVTFVGVTNSDRYLLDICSKFTNFVSYEIVVAGAHLSGMPLNWQLTSRKATLARETTTKPGLYRMYALSETKPGLVRNEIADADEGIKVEVWAFPDASSFGSFVASIPAPLGVGSIALADDSQVMGFLCESYAVRGKRDITSFGGWRSFAEEMKQT